MVLGLTMQAIETRYSNKTFALIPMRKGYFFHMRKVTLIRTCADPKEIARMFWFQTLRCYIYPAKKC